MAGEHGGVPGDTERYDRSPRGRPPMRPWRSPKVVPATWRLPDAIPCCGAESGWWLLADKAPS